MLGRYADIARQMRIVGQKALEIAIIGNPVSALLRAPQCGGYLVAHAFKGDQDSAKSDELEKDVSMRSCSLL